VAAWEFYAVFWESRAGGVRDAGAIAMWAALRRGFGRWVATISLVDEN